MENEININWVTYVKKEDNQKKQSKRGNGYWFIDTNWEIKARDKQLAFYRIQEYCDKERGEFVPDWDDLGQTKFYILYDYSNKRYFMSHDSFFIRFPLLYLARQEHCEEIIEKFKDDLDILFDIKW